MENNRTELRLKIAQQIISIMDKLLKDSSMSLVVRNGKPVIQDHHLNKYYRINNSIDIEIEKHLGY